MTLSCSAWKGASTSIQLFDNLADWQQLAEGVQPGAQVVVLNGTQDGLGQIATHLQDREGVDAIHS